MPDGNPVLLNKQIHQSLVILGVNIVTGGLGGLAFLLFLFRGDPILAAVPAVLALPAVLLQPWSIAFAFLPDGAVLAPPLTTAVSVPLYLFLDRRGKLERAKQSLRRLKTKRTLALAGFVVAATARRAGGQPFLEHAAVLVAASAVRPRPCVHHPVLSDGEPGSGRVARAGDMESGGPGPPHVDQGQFLVEHRVEEEPCFRSARQHRR